MRKPFEKGNKLAVGQKRGPNKVTNDVREAFHKVFNEMGADVRGKDGKIGISGHKAFLGWARQNQTEFYRLYGKMIPQTAELTGDAHEDFLDILLEEEENAKLIEAKAKVLSPAEMGTKLIESPSFGVDTPQKQAVLSPSAKTEGETT